MTRSSDDAAIVQQWAMPLLFPSLLVSFAFAQVRPVPVAVAIGQIASITTILTAVVIVVTALPKSIWPAMLVGGLLVLRGARFAVVESALLYAAYTVLLAALSSAAGALIVVRRPGLLQRQFALFCALSVPLMFLQILGVPWTQFLRSDVGVPEQQYGLVRTLFVPAGQLVINTVQSRPAGILYANNAASVVAAFGLALHYGRLPLPGRITWADVAVLTAVVLLMAKLTFLLLLLFWLMRAVMGRDSRRHVIASVGLTIVLLAIYGVLFPGLFAHNLSWYAMLFDFQVRVAELLMASGVPALVGLAGRFPREILQALGGGATSAYTLMLQQVRTFLPSFVLALPYGWLAFKTMRRFERSLKREVTAVMLATVLVPAITSFLGTFIFWFLAGPALLPLWTLADRAFARSPSR